MGTPSGEKYEFGAFYRLNTAEKKLSLPLWVKLHHAKSSAFFDVLLTLENDPTPAELAQLQAAGLQLSPFHRDNPSKIMPGVIAKDQLEQTLLEFDFIRFVEGHPQSKQ